MRKSLALILCLSVAPSTLFAKTAMEELEFLTTRLQQALVSRDPDNIDTFGNAILELITEGKTLKAANDAPEYGKEPLGLTGHDYGFSTTPATPEQAEKMRAALDLAAFVVATKVSKLNRPKAPVESKTLEDKHKSAAITYYTLYAMPVKELAALIEVSTSGTLLDQTTPVSYMQSPYKGHVYIKDLLRATNYRYVFKETFDWITDFHYLSYHNSSPKEFTGANSHPVRPTLQQATTQVLENLANILENLKKSNKTKKVFESEAFFKIFNPLTDELKKGFDADLTIIMTIYKKIVDDGTETTASEEQKEAVRVIKARSVGFVDNFIGATYPDTEENKFFNSARAKDSKY